MYGFAKIKQPDKYERGDRDALLFFLSLSCISDDFEMKR